MKMGDKNARVEELQEGEWGKRIPFLHHCVNVISFCLPFCGLLSLSSLMPHHSSLYLPMDNPSNPRTSVSATLSVLLSHSFFFNTQF